MGDRSSIEWTDATWNPTTGCDRVSPGCDNCYAATMARRLKAMGNPRYQTDGDPRTSGPGFGLAMHDDVLEVPLRWLKPRRVFVNSMSDLFHPKVTDDFIARVFAVMAAAPQHTFQVLTKRPKRMRALLSSSPFWMKVQASWYRLGLHDRVNAGPGVVGVDHPLPNVWLGTSVEDQQRADDRIPPLLDTPATVRFLSCEPLLGPVDLMLADDYLTPPVGPRSDWGPSIDWIIVGGESGPGARPMHPRWARDLRDQATAAGVPFLFKQWGAWRWAREINDFDYEMKLTAEDRDHYGHQTITGVTPDGARVPSTSLPPYPDDVEWMMNVGKQASGRVLDGRTWDELPDASRDVETLSSLSAVLPPSAGPAVERPAQAAPAGLTSSGSGGPPPPGPEGSGGRSG